MLDVRFAIPELRRLDELRAEVIVLPVHRGERPLRSTSGLVDWRLNGVLSRAILRDRVSTEPGVVTLVSTDDRLPFSKAFVVGAGAPDELAATLPTILRGAIDRLDDARIRHAAWALPGRTIDALDAEVAVEALFRALDHAVALTTVTIVDQQDVHKAMSRVLEAARRRARADDAST